MDLIGVILTTNGSLVAEADYLTFVMDLRSRIGDDATNIRRGCETVGSEDGASFLQFMTRYQANIEDLRSEYQNLSTTERHESLREFLPCILVDFINRRFLTSHEEAGFLNFQSYTPPDWTYTETDITPEVPENLRYWIDWDQS